jgi:nucleoside-diphosphate-sugar epimerase
VNVVKNGNIIFDDLVLFLDSNRKFYFEHINPKDYERFSINYFSWMGSEFAKFVNCGKDDERWLSEIKPLESNKSYNQLIKFVEDRPGHDRRYAVNSSKISSHFGWAPLESFDSGIKKTINWYLENSKWISNVVSGEYKGWIQKNYKI